MKWSCQIECSHCKHYPWRKHSILSLCPHKAGTGRCSGLQGSLTSWAAPWTQGPQGVVLSLSDRMQEDNSWGLPSWLVAEWLLSSFLLAFGLIKVSLELLRQSPQGQCWPVEEARLSRGLTPMAGDHSLCTKHLVRKNQMWGSVSSSF